MEPENLFVLNAEKTCGLRDKTRCYFASRFSRDAFLLRDAVTQKSGGLKMISRRVLTTPGRGFGRNCEQFLGRRVGGKCCENEGAARCREQRTKRFHQAKPLGVRIRKRSQSSSASRRTAGAAGLPILSQQWRWLRHPAPGGWRVFCFCLRGLLSLAFGPFFRDLKQSRRWMGCGMARQRETSSFVAARVQRGFRSPAG